MMLALYGHPFSSYTWKALIALYANDTSFEFRMLDPDHPANNEFVAGASPQGKFPVLVDDGTTVFEATAIIEHLAVHHPGPAPLIPADPAEAVRTRMLDRVFDNHVMAIMQAAVNEALANPEAPDQSRIDAVRVKLNRSYDWLESWLAGHTADGTVSLVECAAAPSLFYADWVERIDPARWPKLAEWRAHLLALPPVLQCVEDARPYRAYFPLGAPERD